MQTKRVLMLGFLLLLVIQLCLADVEDDRHRQVVEQQRRLRKLQLRAERKLAREQRQRDNVERRARRTRVLQDQQQQYLEAGRPQYQNTQPDRDVPPARNRRPMTPEERQLRRQQRLERKNLDRKHNNDRTRGRNKVKAPVKLNLKSNELGEHKRRNGTRVNYVCPPQFVRLSNSCYLLSKQVLGWQDAHHYCRDMNSHLASLETLWEDENMRSYLNRKELARLSRWIGGRFNWANQKWIWGSSGKRMGFQGFSRRDPKEEQQWHCAFMDPVRQYKWAHKSCFDAEHFICEAPLQKEEEGDRDKNEI